MRERVEVGSMTRRNQVGAATDTVVAGEVTITLKKARAAAAEKVTAALRNGRVTVRLPKLTHGRWKLTASYRKAPNFTAITKTITMRIIK